MPSPLRPPPLLNRGAAAWAREDLQPIVLTARHPDVLPIVSRAMVHAVTDDTNIDYLRVVSAALQCIDDGVRDQRWRRQQAMGLHIQHHQENLMFSCRIFSTEH